MSPSPQAPLDHHAFLISQHDQCWLQGMRDFVRFGFKTAQHHRATDFFLLRHNGTGFRFSVTMVDLAERIEVGVLGIESAKNGYRPEVEFDLPKEFCGALRAERLVLRTEHGSVDSGLVLVANGGEEIVMVSGAYPYTISVKARPAVSTPWSFEPEYSIENYERSPVSEKGPG